VFWSVSVNQLVIYNLLTLVKMLNVVYEKDEVMCHEKITERWYEKRGLTDFPLNTVIVDQVPEELQYHCIKNGQLVFDDTRKQ